MLSDYSSLAIPSFLFLVSTVCDELHPCEGLGRYATFKNFGMAFLLLFRVSTGDNWNGIMKVKLTLEFVVIETHVHKKKALSLIYEHVISWNTEADLVLIGMS